MRGGLLAVSAPALAVSAHSLGGGGTPDLSLTLLLTVLTSWVATELAERTRGPLGMLAVLGTGQLVMHIVLTDLIPHGHGASTVNGWTMTAAHVVATCLTAGMLSAAERWLVAAAAGMRRLMPVVRLSAPVPPRPQRPAVTFAPGPELTPLLVRRVHGRRGPPVHS
ncbi:hypothetical protein EWH70_21585 [Amycolatopsis suaedae]|uniref:Uncharacterized protein n=1 Tax=Amycolatopsis suaedae TaxID=2510978 RepID=A0A4Q7J5S6_9PSEU|nr:hypothetical protein EWH70_21585 [Amycolatopsis suaedae]